MGEDLTDNRDSTPTDNREVLKPPTPVRYSKAKAKDMTDPRRHGYKARGGPIERRKVEPDEPR